MQFEILFRFATTATLLLNSGMILSVVCTSISPLCDAFQPLSGICEQTRTSTPLTHEHGANRQKNTLHTAETKIKKTSSCTCEFCTYASKAYALWHRRSNELRVYWCLSHSRLELIQARIRTHIQYTWKINEKRLFHRVQHSMAL